MKNPVRVQAFNKRYGVEYTVLIPGEPKELNDKVPQGVNLNSFPTTFFLGRDGRVRSAHAGFAGKASGKFHTELMKKRSPRWSSGCSPRSRVRTPSAAK